MATFAGICAVLLWGGLALLGSMTASIPAFQLLFICFSISAVIMLVRRKLSGDALMTLPSLSITGWLAGITGLFGFHFFYFMALKLAPAMEVSLIVYLWPLLLTVFVAKSGRRLQATTGGILGFTGIALVIINSQTSSTPSLIDSQNAIYGYLFAFSCAFIWSGYSWYLSRSPGKSDDIGWLSIVVAALSLIAHSLSEDSHWSWSASEWFGALLLGLGPVGGAFYLWDLGMRKGNQTLLASFSFAAPLITAISLALAGLNDWSTEIIIALVLVMLGAGIANYSPRESDSAELQNQV
ncbi:DMT family transporter [Oceanospirillum sediminis]|uniref:EamA family transporter n=1 Tax=Oceanospirillum sediminis TaxID=2760088 RepID=A0A839IR60_9GAMM|nr:EamA family transporter [Oceanospirillum sediminis]MBB1487154.1 EamA family transporter [Oceanospirillum sediminis]